MTAGRVASLREGLRAATRDAHDSLDAGVSGADLARPAEYAAFLQAQLAARLPVERWLATHCDADLRPPATVPLLLDDLHALGRPFSLAPARFDPPADADPLGAAWSIAGSSLGNRAMLAHMRKAGAADLPTAFLSDAAMTTFWTSLRPLLDRPARPGELARASAAARAVFACFTNAFSLAPQRIAA